MTQSDDTKAWVKSLGLFSAILADLIGFTGVGIGAGYWAWKKWNAPWWVILVTTLSGLTVAFWRMYLLSMKNEEK